MKPALQNSFSSIVDTDLVQADLDNIYEWSNQINMVLNDVKFELLRYGKNEQFKNWTKRQTKFW